MTTNLVFVYGTLKSGQPNYHFLIDPKNGQSEPISGQFETVNHFRMVTATQFNIPFLLSNTASQRPQNKSPQKPHQISGEVYSVDQEMLNNLDTFEKYYNRKLISVKNIETGQILKTFCYILDNFNQNLLNLPYIDNFDDSQVGYVLPKNRPSGWLTDQFLESINGPKLYPCFVYGTLKEGQPNHCFWKFEQNNSKKSGIYKTYEQYHGLIPESNSPNSTKNSDLITTKPCPWTCSGHKLFKNKIIFQTKKKFVLFADYDKPEEVKSDEFVYNQEYLIPFLVKESETVKNGVQVVGEIVYLDSIMMEQTDKFEESPEWYLRETITVESVNLEDKIEMEVECYTYPEKFLDEKSKRLDLNYYDAEEWSKYES